MPILSNKVTIYEIVKIALLLIFIVIGISFLRKERQDKSSYQSEIETLEKQIIDKNKQINMLEIANSEREQYITNKKAEINLLNRTVKNLENGIIEIQKERDDLLNRPMPSPDSLDSELRKNLNDRGVSPKLSK